MVYCVDSVRTDHYIESDDTKIYYYTPKEMNEIKKDLPEDPTIVGALRLKKAKKIKRNHNFLYIDGNYYLIKDAVPNYNVNGYIPLGDNKYLQYVEDTPILLPIIIFLLMCIPFIFVAMKTTDIPLDGNNIIETKPIIIPDEEEHAGTIYQPEGTPDGDTATITFTGYPKELTFNEKNRLFYMNNSEVNIFYLKYTISDNVGNVIYESGYISPGCYTFFDMYDYIQTNGNPRNITVIARGYTKTGEGLNSFLYDIKIN